MVESGLILALFHLQYSITLLSQLSGHPGSIGHVSTPEQRILKSLLGLVGSASRGYTLMSEVE